MSPFFFSEMRPGKAARDKLQSQRSSASAGPSTPDQPFEVWTCTSMTRQARLGYLRFSMPTSFRCPTRAETPRIRDPGYASEIYYGPFYFPEQNQRASFPPSTAMDAPV